MRRTNKGMTLVEVGILVGLIAIAAVGILTVFGNTVNEMFTINSNKVGSFKPFGKEAVAQEGVDDKANPGTKNDGSTGSNPEVTDDSWGYTPPEYPAVPPISQPGITNPPISQATPTVPPISNVTPTAQPRPTTPVSQVTPTAHLLPTPTPLVDDPGTDPGHCVKNCSQQGI